MPPKEHRFMTVFSLGLRKYIDFPVMMVEIYYCNHGMVSCHMPPLLLKPGAPNLRRGPLATLLPLRVG